MRTMLVVEDDPAWRALYQEQFGAEFAICEVADGLQALSMLERVRPDLIVLDLRLPRMDGLDLLRAMDRKGIRVPVVICAGIPPEDVRDHFPGVRLARKSADLRDLRGAIREALGISWRAPLRPASGPDWLD